MNDKRYTITELSAQQLIIGVRGYPIQHLKMLRKYLERAGIERVMVNNQLTYQVTTEQIKLINKLCRQKKQSK